jgi:large subunit ribosomal protein L3
MLNSVLGKKIGMTQVFDAKGNVVPVTVVDISNLFVTQIKTPEKDGYTAVQVGMLRKRYRGESFSPAWLEAKKDIFLHIREVQAEHISELTQGQALTIDNSSIQEGMKVVVTGTSKGLGFQGVVKRWGFAGGPKAHGSKFHRRPGSSGNMRRQGEVLKGKKFPGHMGTDQVSVKGLTVVRIDRENGCLFIKGALPGKKESLVLVKKQGN